MPPSRLKFDPRPLVARFVAKSLEDARRLARASFSKQLAAVSLKAGEQTHLARALAVSGGNKSDAARLLQIDRRSLQRKAQRIRAARRRGR